MKEDVRIELDVLHVKLADWTASQNEALVSYRNDADVIQRLLCLAELHSELISNTLNNISELVHDD